MSRFRTILVSSTIAFIVGGCSILPDLLMRRATAQAGIPIYVTPAERSGVALEEEDGFQRADEDAPRRLDIRGNEITKPLARYRLDGRGTLYEVHSPQTEVPRLKPPTS